MCRQLEEDMCNASYSSALASIYSAEVYTLSVSSGQVSVERAKTLGSSGWDRVQFVMNANDGQTRGAVDTVASSGEKSRLLLLLETRLPSPSGLSATQSTRDGYGDEGDRARNLPSASSSAGSEVGEKSRLAPCAVLYDEIDAHVGGRTAVAVGRLLANQGRDSQVRGADCLNAAVVRGVTDGVLQAGRSSDGVPVSCDSEKAFDHRGTNAPCTAECTGALLPTFSPSALNEVPSRLLTALDMRTSAPPNRFRKSVIQSAQ